MVSRSDEKENSCGIISSTVSSRIDSRDSLFLEEDLGVKEVLGLEEEEVGVVVGDEEPRVDSEPKLQSMPPFLLLTGVDEGASSSTITTLRGSGVDEDMVV